VTCNVVLPSVNTATTTEPGKTGPSPTASRSGSAAAAEGGRINVVDGGLVLGALLAVVGML